MAFFIASSMANSSLESRRSMSAAYAQVVIRFGNPEFIS